MKASLPAWHAALRPSRLAGVLGTSLTVAGWCGAALSGHPGWMRFALASLVTLLALEDFRRAGTHAPRQVWLGPDDRVRLVEAAGAVREAPLQGYAQLGALAVFVFVARPGWRRWLGPERIAVWRDALDADGFRRLRVRLRMG